MTDLIGMSIFTAGPSAAPPHDTASDGFVLSHLSDKNKDVAKVGHPKSVVRARNSLSASEAGQDDSAVMSRGCHMRTEKSPPKELVASEALVSETR
jgi:hypothetical protein